MGGVSTPTVPGSGPAILTNRDYDFFYDGLKEQRLLVQQCDSCHEFRNPPGPMCPECNSFDWTARDMPSSGTVFSFTIHRHPPLPDYDTPHPIGLVEFANGVRFVAPLAGIAPDDVRIGLPVEVQFRQVGSAASFAFVPTAQR